VEATARLHIREQYAGVPLESLKSRVLKVRKLRDTKILEISVTMTDPKKAQALAQYIAERTVSMSRSLDRSADDDLTQESGARVNAAKARVASADRELAGAAVEGTEALRSEIEATVDLDARLRRDLAEAKADLAEFVGEEQGGGAAGGEHKRVQMAALNARIAELERQRAAAQTAVQAKEAVLGKRESRLDSLRQEQTSARAELERAISRLNEITVAAGLRSERLKIIDPGIVPERPSFPNRPALVFAALLISTVLSLIYIALAFHFRRPRIHERERSHAFG
jgi:capsule polysaccharide export protein KpsE/RkpR